MTDQRTPAWFAMRAGELEAACIAADAEVSSLVEELTNMKEDA